MAEVLTVAGLILTVLLAYMQIQRTHVATIRAQENHLRNELKVRTYEVASARFLDAAEKLSVAISKAQAPVSTLALQLKGLPLQVSETNSDLADIHNTCSRALSAVLVVLEQYEIAFANFGSIRRKFSQAHLRWLEVHNPFYSKILLLIPTVDQATGNLAGPLSRPTEASLAEVQGLLDAYTDAGNEIQGYLIDIQIEAQNELLGGLFARTLPPRSPLDPQVRVLTREKEPQGIRPPGALV